MIDLPTAALLLAVSRSVVKDVHATGRRLLDRRVLIELTGRRHRRQRVLRFEVEDPGGTTRAPCPCAARGDER